MAVTVNTTATELKAQGYTIDPLTIIGPVGPDGENITLTGTVQEIHSQLLEINSSYNVSVDVDSFTLDVATKHEKRCPDKILCGLTNYTPANPRPILEGAVYLEGFKGVLCHVEAGPKRCVRFSCSYNSAIWLCNDVSSSGFRPRVLGLELTEVDRPPRSLTSGVQTSATIT